MSVHAIELQMPGCDRRCLPGGRHHPEPHQEHGRLLEREARRQAVVRSGPLVVDLAARTATVDGVEIHCAPREWELLAYLAEHVGAWRTDTEIRADVWGSTWRLEHSHSLVSSTRARLRERLGAGAALIECRTSARPGLSVTRLRLETEGGTRVR